MLNNGVALKSRLGIIQCHSQRLYPIDCEWFPIHVLVLEKLRLYLFWRIIKLWQTDRRTDGHCYDASCGRKYLNLFVPNCVHFQDMATQPAVWVMNADQLHRVNSAEAQTTVQEVNSAEAQTTVQGRRHAVVHHAASDDTSRQAATPAPCSVVTGLMRTCTSPTWADIPINNSHCCFKSVR